MSADTQGLAARAILPRVGPLWEPDAGPSWAEDFDIEEGGLFRADASPELRALLDDLGERGLRAIRELLREEARR